MVNGNGTQQYQLLFRVPNTPYGRAFIEWAKSFLNTDSYRLKVRGRDGIPLKDAKTLRVYMMAKTPSGVKTVGITEANQLSGRQQFYQDAYIMRNALSRTQENVENMKATLTRIGI